MKTGKYLFLFLLFLVNLIAFVNVLQNMSLNMATIQIFVIFAYLIIAAMILYGLGNNRRWSMAGGAVLFFAHLVNIALIFRTVQATSIYVIGVVSIIGFLYCMRNLEPARRPVAQEVIVPAEPVVIEKYGAGGSGRKSAGKRSAKRSSGKRPRGRPRKKKSLNRKASKSAAKSAVKSQIGRASCRERVYTKV